MRVNRIFNKEENKYYFVIFNENEVKTIQADDEAKLQFELNSGTITATEHHACLQKMYKGDVIIYDGNF